MNLKKILKNTTIGITILSTLGIANISMASGDCAFAVGGSFTDLNIESAVTNAANAHTNLGYHSYYAKSADYDTLNGYFSNGTRRLESDILFFAGHGSSGSIVAAPGVGVCSYTGRSGFVYTGNINWANTKLVTIMGCYTGQETSQTYVNIAHDIFTRSGYKSTTLGWRNTIYDVDIVKWSNRYYTKLKEGKNLRDAIDYANSYGSYHSDTIKDLAFYGAWDMTIKKSSNARSLNSTYDIEDEGNSNLLKIKEDIYFTRDNPNIDLIVEKMKQLYPNFDINNFEINIHKLSDTEEQFTIDFNYKIGEFYTNEGYVISIRDGKVYEITDNMNYAKKYDIQQESVNKVDSYEEKTIIKDATQTLRKKKSELGNIEIVSQKVKYCIDRSKNEKSIEILTEYKLDDGSMGGTVYKKDL